MIQLVFHAASAATALPKQSSSILDPIAKPIATVLAFFYSIVPNYAFAILALSLVWMVIISPLTLKTTRSMLAMQKLAPEIKRLGEKHRNDRQALSAAQMDLYKEHNVSPFGSCLPSILPLPVFIALFRVIDGLSSTSVVNGQTVANPKYLSSGTAMYHAIRTAGGHLNAFGLDLSKSALSSHTSFATALPFYVLLLAMMGTGYFQTAQMMSRNPAAQQQGGQMAIMKFMPLIIGVVCIRFPAGVVLYYAMSNLCRIGQQFLMYRYDPKVRALAIKDVIEIEAKADVVDDEPTSKMFGGKRASTPPHSGPAGRSRFRDLLGSAMDQQAAGRERAAERRANAAGNNGSAPSKPIGRSGQGNAKKPEVPARAKAPQPKAVSGGSTKSPSNSAGKPNRTPAPSGTPATPGTPPAPGISGTKGKGAVRAGRRSQPAPAVAPPVNGRPAPVANNRVTDPVNGKAAASPNGATPPQTQGIPPRPPSGRTGAGGRRTGGQGSSNKRRDR